MSRIAIIGAGAWGTALAQALALSGQPVVLLARQAGLVAQLNTARTHPHFGDTVRLAPSLLATTNWHDVAGARTMLLAVPAQQLRAVATHAHGFVGADTTLVITAKGIEQSTGSLLPQLLAEILPNQPLALLSGPSFAAEVVMGLPTALTIASQQTSIAEAVAKIFAPTTIRPYTSSDVVGVALGGALKNVLAIAAGLCMGASLGENARAALITRGLAEMTRLTVAAGGKAETLMGLAGLGDLALTATSEKSRNYGLGLRLARGESLAHIQSHSDGVQEGVATASAALVLATRLGVELPIISAVAQILVAPQSLRDILQQLLTRPLKAEH